MSEPMSNHEIEDVLSSIRRLVSEDLRPATKPAEEPAPLAHSPVSPSPVARSATTPDKLLLTPALRVVEPAAEMPPPAAEEPAPAPAPLAEEEVQDVVARLGAAVGEGDEEWESPLGDPPAWPDPVQAEPPPRFRAVAEEAPDPAPAFLDQGEDYYAEVEETDFVQTTEADEKPPAAAPRRVMAPPMDDWADAAEAEVRASLEREIEDEAESMFSGPEVAFDEEVLRDLVRDIIREELAGTLGERITRNVRKLVRAEIARALAVREFE